jgi:hypothetical protein
MTYSHTSTRALNRSTVLWFTLDTKIGWKKVHPGALPEAPCGALQQVDAVARVARQVGKMLPRCEQPCLFVCSRSFQLDPNIAKSTQNNPPFFYLLEMTASEPLTIEEEYEMQESWRVDENSRSPMICPPPPSFTSSADFVFDARLHRYDKHGKMLSTLLVRLIPQLAHAGLYHRPYLISLFVLLLLFSDEQ